MSSVDVNHVYWWFSTADKIYIRSVSGNKVNYRWTVNFQQTEYKHEASKSAIDRDD